MYVIHEIESIFFFFFVFSRAAPTAYGGSRLGGELELQLLAYTTVTAMLALSCTFDLHQNSWQCQILNPLNEARDQTHILMDPSQVC